jgi:pentose-5-phosphate-3-epimerase
VGAVHICYLDRLAHAGGKGLSFGMDPTRFRLRYVLGMIAAAALTAAALRHFVHVDGGFSREEIRICALGATTLIVLVIIFFRRKRRP